MNKSLLSKPAPADLFDLDLHHKYLYFRRTKIVATIGPATSSPEKLRRLIAGGLDVARINFSHGEAHDHVKTIRLIRSISGKLGKPVAILGDLCGPKIRVGEFEGGSAVLKNGSTVFITPKPVMGTATLIPSQYKGIIKESQPGNAILLDDGNLELKVVRKYSDRIEAKVVNGGVLKNHKGMNLPDAKLGVAALTAKDREDVLYCIKGEVDYIALSFVRKPKDIIDLKQWLARNNADIPVIAKIEMPEALINIRAIMELADGIMVARGDLGVEVPAKKVPIIQNKLIQIANKMSKPVIVATQMLESMIEHPRPTRAEVTDVAAACLAGADAVMMSAETAAGEFPLESFATMNSILRETEAYQFFSRGGRFGGYFHGRASGLLDAIGEATAQLSRDLMVHCIFVLTVSGYTARIVSSDRPAAPVIAFTHSEKVARRMHLLWGVYPHCVKKSLSTQEHLTIGERILREKRLAKKGDFVIMISGLKDIGTKATAIMLHRVG
ncbi:MAG TPA: pyruvate kinase [Chitinivibrionales bacterium]|jgi:pyruvate kinase|nr:pyruvate kinase [Chitinivibrionales bacterium]